jgi:hypothetical protein
MEQEKLNHRSLEELHFHLLFHEQSAQKIKARIDQLTTPPTDEQNLKSTPP